jgi:hypothetical protein
MAFWTLQAAYPSASGKTMYPADEKGAEME